MNSRPRCLITLAILSALAAIVWYATSISLQRSHYVVLQHRTLDAVTQHIEKRGSWPTSWDDLRDATERPQDGTPWEAMEEKVHIDFTLSLEDVAAMTPATFTAIRNKGRPYPPDPGNGRVGQLLAAAARALAADASSPRAHISSASASHAAGDL